MMVDLNKGQALKLYRAIDLFAEARVLSMSEGQDANAKNARSIADNHLRDLFGVDLVTLFSMAYGDADASREGG